MMAEILAETQRNLKPADDGANGGSRAEGVWILELSLASFPPRHPRRGWLKKGA